MKQTVKYNREGNYTLEGKKEKDSLIFLYKYTHICIDKNTL